VLATTTRFSSSSTIRTPSGDQICGSNVYDDADFGRRLKVINYTRGERSSARHEVIASTSTSDDALAAWAVNQVS
jgi:hypothetical protein